MLTERQEYANVHMDEDEDGGMNMDIGWMRGVCKKRERAVTRFHGVAL